MKGKVAVFISFLILCGGPVSGVISTSQIDIVRSKEVLDGGDLQIIDNFVVEGIGELIKTSDFTSVSRVRSTILSRSSSQKESAAKQYAEQFLESSHRHLSSGFEQAAGLASGEQRVKVTMNLLILVDSLGDVRLSELALGRLDDENEAVRYWAVHCLSNDGIVSQLKQNPGDNLGLVTKILGRFRTVVQDSGPEIVAMIAGFAGAVDAPQGRDLLLEIAGMRINRYADWTVRHEHLDATILRLLCEKLSKANDPAVGRSFGQLYSYAMQKYINDLKGGDFLTSEQRRQLASVLVETEKSCLGEFLGMPQTTIKNAIDQGDYVSLLAEHNRLFGDQAGQGQLPAKLKFDYGRDTDGSVRTMPLVLPEPPEG